jgi:nucleotide-binding universal stress UspA family protein
MHTILVPLDGSARADQVLPHVAYLARQLNAGVLLLRVVPEPLYDSPVLQDVAVVDRVAARVYTPLPEVAPVESLRRYAVEDEHAAALALRAQGLEVELDVEVGDPAETIVEVAASRGVSMIAMATHGYGGVRRWALGSVTDKVIQASPVPVYVVRSAARASETQQPLGLRRVLVPLDGSPLALQALPLATELAAASGAHLILLRALQPAGPIEQPAPLLSDERPRVPGDAYIEASSQVFAELQTLAGQLHEQHGVVVACNVRPGAAAEAIIEEAEQRDVDLVVMATHGYGGLRRLALGSVADKVLHGGMTPLLLVRAGEVMAPAAS